MTETPSYKMGSLLGNHFNDLLPSHHLFVTGKTEITHFKKGGERLKYKTIIKIGD